MLLLYPSHRLVESAEIHIGALSLTFTPVLLPGARKAVMAAAVDDTDAVREVADAYRALVTLVESPAPRSPRREAVAPVAVPLALQVAPPATDGLDSAAERLRIRILARGWRVEDLVGLPGGDDLSPAAGRSVTAGLGAMEMLATSPPDFWQTLSAHFYPWEVSGWLPPDSEWRAPAAPAKPPAETEPQTTPEVDVVTPATDELPEDKVLTAPSGPPDIGPDHPAVGVYGTLEQVRAARVIAWKLLGPDGQKPSFKKLAAQLKANYDLALPDLGAGHMNLIYTP